MPESPSALEIAAISATYGEVERMSHRRVIASKAGIAGINLADGKGLWKYAFDTKYGTGTPVIDGDTVYYSTDGKGTAATGLGRAVRPDAAA